MKFSSFLTLTLLAVFSLSIANAAEQRTWTDTKGRKVEAEMIGFSDGNVHLKLPDGRKVAFPFRLLSENDRGYVRENAPADPRTAARQIDTMIRERLIAANAEIKAAKVTAAKDPNLSRDDKVKELKQLDFQEKMTHPTPNTTDEQFLRRAYLDIAGRIPTYQEASEFLRTRDDNKRSKLIDQLLDSEAFASHFFNYLSDLLRVRDGLSMGGFDNLKSGAYADWIKDQIRNDTPWNVLVTQLISAEGYYWDNPATGYMLTDFGMELCNLSNTFTVFTGTEITCAQCHDHPFEEVYQMDFYKMAAFFGNMRFDTQGDPELTKTVAAKRKEFAAEAKKREKDTRGLDPIFTSYGFRLGDADQNSIRLPFDYKYDDGEPNASVAPATWFGEIVKLEQFSTPREAFADWLTSEENPRFTVNIVNRLWKHVFGYGQIEPVDNIPGHLEGQAQNYELLKFLESLMRELDYSMKDFLRVLYKTKTYQKEACHHSPTLTMIDRGEYHFPAPILRRMTAEQFWDSLVALSTDFPEENKHRMLESYQEVMRTDWSQVSYDEAMKIQQRYANLGRGGMMMSNNRNKKNPGAALLYRASEQPLPAPVGSFLYSFGQSDKQFIENATQDGTIPQVMMLLNGDLTNKIMSNASRAVVATARAEDSHDEGIDVCFLSTLSRRPSPYDRDYAEKLVRGGKGSSADYSDLIWALLNTREFMFIQ